MIFFHYIIAYQHASEVKCLTIVLIIYLLLLTGKISNQTSKKFCKYMIPLGSEMIKETIIGIHRITLF